MPVQPISATETDHQLVQRTLAGEPRAFEMLVVKYQRRVERLVARLVRDTDLVPDIAQDTFIRAYRGLGQFRGEAQFYTWLYRIAVNTANKALLELKRHPSAPMGALDRDGRDDGTFGRVHGSNAPLADTETPEALLASKEIAEAVQRAMDALPRDLGQAIALREIEGLSYGDIAQALGCPVGTVRSRIFRAREAISARIKPMLERQTGKRW